MILFKNAMLLFVYLELFVDYPISCFRAASGQPAMSQRGSYSVQPSSPAPMRRSLMTGAFSGPGPDPDEGAGDLLNLNSPIVIHHWTPGAGEPLTPGGPAGPPPRAAAWGAGRQTSRNKGLACAGMTIIYFSTLAVLPLTR